MGRGPSCQWHKGHWNGLNGRMRLGVARPNTGEVAGRWGGAGRAGSGTPAAATVGRQGVARRRPRGGGRRGASRGGGRRHREAEQQEQLAGAVGERDGGRLQARRARSRGEAGHGPGRRVRGCRRGAVGCPGLMGAWPGVWRAKFRPRRPSLGGGFYGEGFERGIGRGAHPDARGRG